MPDIGALLGRCDSVAKQILQLAALGKKLLVVTHIDADGLASGSIVFAALMRKGANVTVRAIPDLDQNRIGELKADRFDYYIFTDLGSTLLGELNEALDGRFLVIDHHQLPEEDLANASVVNSWQYGIDGGTGACSSSMAYAFSRAVDPANSDLSSLAVIGAVADRQDSGPGRALTDLNRFALDEALLSGSLSVEKDLIFAGRETRPVHEAIALTSNPYLPGLSGSKDAALAALKRSGFELKESGHWRTVSELSSDEKMKVTEVIAGVVSATGDVTASISELFGEVYTLKLEDQSSPLRDAREFGTLLNATGRMDRAGVGVAVCLGDRGVSLSEAIRTLSEYRSNIGKAMDAISSDESRQVLHGHMVFVRGDGVVDEKLLGPVTSILTSAPGRKDKVVVARTSSGEGELKFSSRVGDDFAGSVNLGTVMRESAEAVGGVGGGHEMAAGAKIPAARADLFEKLVLEKVAA